jgi:hypothetical protein
LCTDAQHGPPKQLASHKVFIDHLLHARKQYMKGDCYDYFNQKSILGWCYRGDSKDDKVRL